MSDTIWKTPLKLSAPTTVRVKYGARPLTAQVQHGVPCVWWRVDPTREDVERTVHIVGTGHELPRADGWLSYIGTVQEAGGALIWHVFYDDVEEPF